MRNFVTFLISLSFIACNDRNTKMDKIRQDSLQTAVHTEVTKIMVNDIASTGKITKAIQIDSMEIVKVSRKEYYNYEMKEQDERFKNYLNYVRKQKNPVSVYESLVRHDSVMAYLKNAIRTASEKPEIYKVDYYLKTRTQTAKYDQRRTTFLDSSLKKIVTDYSFLKVVF